MRKNEMSFNECSKCGEYMKCPQFIDLRVDPGIYLCPTCRQKELKNEQI